MSNITTSGLRKFNLIMAAFHAVQGVIILALSRTFDIPITGSYLTFNTTTQTLEPASTRLFDLPIPLLIAIFFFLSAAAHLFVATLYNKRYNQDLAHGINKVRWVEYSLSASVMMVAIAVLVGVYDFTNLLMIFFLIAIMNLMGLVMELHNQLATKVSWISYWVGCLAGIIPWFVIGFCFWLSADQGSAPPAFVYWIFFSIFLFFSSFAINMLLQYKKIGPWKDYMFGERVYIILSLVAKTLLAWQVYAGTLQPA